MVKLCEDLLGEILRRLSEEDLVKCQSVSKSWRRVSSHLWVLRFWTHKSPVLGLYFRITGLKPSHNFYHMKEPSHNFYHMNYISLYNYSFMEDNLELDPSTPESTFLRVKQELQFFRHWRWTVADDYLDCCNGLVLVLKSGTHQLYVCNPVTRRHVAIPKASDHRQQQFCAALAFDPSESPSHYRVVRIDPSSSSLDMFSSQSCRWARHQLDPDFTRGFDLCRRHFVYLRGVLYSIASSGDQLLCIHLNTATVQSRSLQLPDSDCRSRSQACLGVSMETLCYFYRHDESNMFHVWSYDDSSSGEWVLGFSISCKKLRWLMLSIGYHYADTPATFEPYAISPSSDVIFFGTPRLILSYDFNTRKIKFVCESSFNIVASPVFALRACFLPLYQLRKRNGGSTDVSEDSPAVSEDILSVELPCDEELEEDDDDDEIQVINIRLFSREQKRLIFPSEMH